MLTSFYLLCCCYKSEILLVNLLNDQPCAIELLDFLLFVCSGALSLGFGIKPFDPYQNMVWNSCLGDDMPLEVYCLVLYTK